MIRVGSLFLLCLVGAYAKYHQKTSSSHHEKGAWIVYDSDSFFENELCVVLSCRYDEVCMVRNNNAMCVAKSKVSQVDGEKKNFHKSHHKDRGNHKSSHDQKEEGYLKKEDHFYKKFDKDRFQQKLKKYKQKEEGARRESYGNEYYKPRDKQYFDKTQSKPEIPAQRRHNPEVVEKQCSEKELESMGGRLLQWFTDVHASRHTVSVPLPKHHIRCRQDVGWMFQQWDGDQSGQLTAEELRTLEQDEYEECLKPFIDRCDIDRNDLISLDEWCDCFEFSDHVRDEPPCHKKQRSQDPHLLGSWIPRCDVEGWFRPEQCHEGYCWCVDPLGREFDHSRVRHAHADCGQYAEPTDDEDLHSEEGSGYMREL